MDTTLTMGYLAAWEPPEHVADPKLRALWRVACGVLERNIRYAVEELFSLSSPRSSNPMNGSEGEEEDRTAMLAKGARA
jgi:hypothetical protein